MNQEQRVRETNIDAIVSFFESGIKQEPGELGIELEHTLIKRKGAAPVSYSETHGVQWLLHQLEKDYPKASFDFEGDILGVARGNESVTIEPAAQLELSAGPFKKLDDATRCFEDFETHLGSILASANEEAILLGYHPTACADDLELIPKKRYRFMDTYFRKIGPWGPRMMRGSASTQVSIDYQSTEDCLRKLRLAFALVPIFSLICDNTPFFEGKPRSHKLIRTKIWQECDPGRCGTVPGVMDPDFSLRKYAAYILDTPAIITPCCNEEWCYTEKTFAEIYADRLMDKADIEHALSMFFTDVRLKTYIEIRPADAMPIPYVISYAALIRGLFYSSSNLDEMDLLFSAVDARAIDDAKNALMAKGYRAQVYGRPVSELCDRLIELAYRGIPEDEYAYLQPLASLVEQRTTLADISERDDGASFL